MTENPYAGEREVESPTNRWSRLRSADAWDEGYAAALAATGSGPAPEDAADPLRGADPDALYTRAEVARRENRHKDAAAFVEAGNAVAILRRSATGSGTDRPDEVVCPEKGWTCYRLPAEGGDREGAS